ncbi:hypothetical protein BC940DRAFT_276759, partial [Gongronella butleri]
MFYQQQQRYPEPALGAHHVYQQPHPSYTTPYGSHQLPLQQVDPASQQQNSVLVSMEYTPYYHDDPAAFAYFQQELSSPRLQGTMM